MSIESLATGGIIGAVLLGANWLVRWFKSAATDGENLADKRVSALLEDFTSLRERFRLDQAATDAELRSLRLELADYRVDLTHAREQERECRSELHKVRLRLETVEAELQRLKSDPEG